MKNIITKLIKVLLKKDYYILTDPEDGSVTLSEDLYHRMQKDCGGRLDEVYTFAVGDSFGWQCNPKDDEQLKGYEGLPVAKVQYNSKSKSIGFMPTNPTLAWIYYELKLPEKKLLLDVKRVRIEEKIYYILKY